MQQLQQQRVVGRYDAATAAAAGAAAAGAAAAAAPIISLIKS